VLIFRRRKHREEGDKSPTTITNPTYQEVCEKSKPPVAPKPKPKPIKKSENDYEPEPNIFGDYITVADPETDPRTLDTETTKKSDPPPPYEKLQPPISPRAGSDYEELRQET